MQVIDVYDSCPTCCALKSNYDAPLQGSSAGLESVLLKYELWDRDAVLHYFRHNTPETVAVLDRALRDLLPGLGAFETLRRRSLIDEARQNHFGYAHVERLIVRGVPPEIVLDLHGTIWNPRRVIRRKQPA